MPSRSNSVLLSDFAGQGSQHDVASRLDGSGNGHKASFFDHYIRDSWWLEIISWLVATILLLALLILLGKYNGKALSKWHSGLSLNTIIAVVTQLVQMVLMVPIASSLSQLQWLWYRNKKPLQDISAFQEASGGLVSSLLLLSRRLTSLIVWLGVLSMILQVLLGPFAQQALSIPTRPIIVDSTAAIARSLTYTKAQSGDGVGIADDGNAGTTQAMKYAIITGLMRDGVQPSEVQGNSSTGNVTFGIFNSMAVCASVENVTSSIVSDCTTKDHASGISDDECTYSVPELQAHPPAKNAKTSNATLYLGASGIYEEDQFQDDPSEPINSTLIEFYVIYLPDLSATEEGDFTGELVALKGTLALCAQTFNSSVQFGITKTTVVNEHRDLTWTHGQGGYNAAVPDSTDNLHMEPDALLELSLWLNIDVFSGTAQIAGPPGQSTDPESGSSDIEESAAPIFTSTGVQQLAAHLYGSEYGYTAPNGMQVLTDLLNNVATSMTNA